MSKNKKHKRPTFNEMVEAMRIPKVDETVSNKEIRVDSANVPENQLFRWVFLPYVIRRKNDKFGFGKYKNDAEKFLFDIEIPLHEKYINKTWNAIDNLPHCGSYKKNSLSQKQRIKMSCMLSKYFSEEQVQEIENQVYHVCLNGAHRLFGYRYNSIFYIVLNDENHNFDRL